MRLLLMLGFGLSAGCLWTPKPYANDPLVRHRRAILGDTTQVPVESRWTEPVAPPPPSDVAP